MTPRKRSAKKGISHLPAAKSAANAPWRTVSGENAASLLAFARIRPPCLLSEVRLGVETAPATGPSPAEGGRERGSAPRRSPSMMSGSSSWGPGGSTSLVSALPPPAMAMARLSMNDLSAAFSARRSRVAGANPSRSVGAPCQPPSASTCDERRPLRGRPVGDDILGDDIGRCRGVGDDDFSPVSLGISPCVGRTLAFGVRQGAGAWCAAPVGGLRDGSDPRWRNMGRYREVIFAYFDETRASHGCRVHERPGGLTNRGVRFVSPSLGNEERVGHRPPTMQLPMEGVSLRRAGRRPGLRQRPAVPWPGRARPQQARSAAGLAGAASPTAARFVGRTCAVTGSGVAPTTL